MTNSTSSCVKCTEALTCPSCSSDEYCAITALTCNSCPKTYCAKKPTNSNNSTITTTSNFNSNSKKLNAIISGSVVGGVFFIFIGCITLLYFIYWKPRLNKRKIKFQSLGLDFNLNKNNILFIDENDINIIHSDIDDLNNSDIDDDDDDDLLLMDDDEDDYSDFNNNDIVSNHDITSTRMNYNSSLMPSMLPRQQKNTNNQFRNIHYNKRLSLSTINTRASSNILPIAYIPGVTGTTTTNHHYFNDDIKSHITLSSSIFDDNNSDTFSLNNNNHNTNLSKIEFKNISSTPNTISFPTISHSLNDNNNNNNKAVITAIKAKPKLVQIEEEEEEQQDTNRNTIIQGEEDLVLDLDIEDSIISK